MDRACCRRRQWIPSANSPGCEELPLRYTPLLAALSLVCFTGAVHAQGYPGGQYNPGKNPSFSPYLNLVRRDAPLVNNYFGLVRPEMNFRNALQQLETQQATASNQQPGSEYALTLPATGHAS